MSHELADLFREDGKRTAGAARGSSRGNNANRTSSPDVDEVEPEIIPTEDADEDVIAEPELIPAEDEVSEVIEEEGADGRAGNFSRCGTDRRTGCNG